MNGIKIIGKFIDLLSISSPFIIYYFPKYNSIFWDLSLYSVFILMCIRPLANIFPKFIFIKLMPLRKNLGIFSSIIIVSFGFIHYFGLGYSEFINEYFSLSFWSGKLLWAHLGELTGFILLITSNIFSMRLLKRNWKRIQRLSYIYFFSGAIYVFLAFNKTFGIIAIIIVFELTLFAYIKKRIIINEETGILTWRW